MHLWPRVLAVVVIIPTIAMLVVHGNRDGYETLYFLLPDAILCIGLLAAAIHGGRLSLLAAFALALGVFTTATLGAL